MAGGPSVTATIQGNDLLTGVLTKVVENSHQLMEKVNRGVEDHAARQASAMDRFRARFSQVSSAVNEAATGMFAGFGAHFLHEASHIATEMSGLERKMQAFAGLSKRQADDIRRSTDVTFSGSTGGPTGQMELATQLLNNGFTAPQLAGMVQPISLYATETNQALGEAATEFAGHLAMLRRVRDDMGREISIGEASPVQIKHAAEESFGALTTYFKQMQGSFKDVMEFSKVAAPSSNMLKVPEHFMFAEEAVLSQQGIRGEVAGTAVAGFNRRLINRTAKSRAAMAEAGLNYSDYVTVDPDRISAKGVLDAFMQRAGTASASTIAAINRSVEQFHKDRDLDKFNVALTDDFISSGNKGLKNRVAAANAAGDITQGSVAAVDQLKFLQDVHDKNVGFGLLQPMFREATNAVLLMAQNVDELKRIRGEYDKADNQKTYDTAAREQFDNYAGAQQNLHGAVQGLQDQLFQPLEGPLTHVFNTVADGIRDVAGAGNSAKTILDAVLVSGTAIAGLKTAGTLATMAGGLMKFATGAEQVGPLVGALGLLADVPFLPIVAGIGALAAGFEAFEHRAELWHAFENWKNGTVDSPTTPAEADELRAKVDRDRKALADHAKAIEDHAAVMDPAVRAAREHASEVLRRGLMTVDTDPAVVAAREQLAQAENHNPRHDASIHEARAHLADVQAAYDKRQAVTDERIEALHRVIATVQHKDPLADDDELRRVQTEIAGKRARLGAAAENDPAFRALDAKRKEREDYLVLFQRMMIAKAGEMIEAERDQLGAPKVTAADLDTARKAADAAPAVAQEQHRAAVDTAQAQLDRALAAARQAVEQSQAVIEANANAATAADTARNGPRAQMDKQADPEIARLSADIAKLSGVLSDYDKAHGQAYAASHPMFTRAGMGLNERPDAPDYARSSVPRTGPAFGLEGPRVDVGALSSSLTASIMRAIYPERQAQKVDVNATVKGTVEGKGDVSGKVDVSLQPSRYFEGVMRRAELAGTMALHGDMSGGGGGEYMGGPNGVVQQPGRGGIGHM